MITQKMNRARFLMITEALTDYLEHYCEEEHEPFDVSYLANDHFDEFVNWAYDDLIISAGERDLLLNSLERELIKTIKMKAVRGYLMSA